MKLLCSGVKSRFRLFPTIIYAVLAREIDWIIFHLFYLKKFKYIRLVKPKGIVFIILTSEMSHSDETTRSLFWITPRMFVYIKHILTCVAINLFLTHTFHELVKKLKYKEYVISKLKRFNVLFHVYIMYIIIYVEKREKNHNYITRPL